MDKQAAIDFVLDELDKGRSLQDITAALSRQLGAPADLVGKFVAQTADRYQQSKAQGRQPVALSPQLSAYSLQSVAPNQQPSAYSRQPVTPSQPPSAYSSQTEMSWPAAAGMAADEPIPEPNAPYVPPETVETSPRVEQEPAVSAVLEKFILDELGKNKRDSDVALEVVERTGWDFRQAQRMVSRVGARNYKKVAARQNCLIIPLALVALVAGLVLLGASVIEAYQIRFLLPSPNDLNIEQVQAAVERGRDLPWAFITGLALAVGGGIGLIAAIRKQME
jgi:hypothetical protein